MKLKKSLYEFLKSVLLFYQNLSSDMRNKGFAIISYDPCVVNKMVNGKRIMVTWHVYDLKISCVKSSEVTRIIKCL